MTTLKFDFFAVTFCFNSAFRTFLKGDDLVGNITYIFIKIPMSYLEHYIFFTTIFSYPLSYSLLKPTMLQYSRHSRHLVVKRGYKGNENNNLSGDDLVY